MTVTLYILGLLIRHGSMHGYQIKQTIDKHISDFAKIKTGNIYYHLNSMNKKGLVSNEVISGKKNKDKTVYTITNSGIELFHNQLDKAANDFTSFEFIFDSVLFFREHIDKEKLKHNLDNKINILDKIVTKLEKHNDHINKNISKENTMYANAIFSHHLVHYKAELEWYKSLKENI